MDSVFKALADPSRRALLDTLRREDGQTLSQLEEALPLSRFGVAKHLTALQDAGLVTRVKRGRFTHHYLNAIPLAEVMERWIEPYRVAPAVRGVMDLKHKLEGSGQAAPDFALTMFIQCRPDDLWAALTEPDAFLAWPVPPPIPDHSGEDYALSAETPPIICRPLEEQPPTRLITSFEPQWNVGGDPSRVAWGIVQEGSHCRLTVEHFDLTGGTPPRNQIADGWARWTSSLKTLLETGKVVPFAQGPPD